jgi:uncharacterized membrane protein
LVVTTSIASPIASRHVIASGHGVTVALLLAGANAVAYGLALLAVLPARAWPVALLVPAALLAGLALGEAYSTETGPLVAIGMAHALLQAAMLAVFGASLLPGRVALITRLARRINPGFRAGMVQYTRVVTSVWCGFFVVQLAGSALLLALAPVRWWLLWVGGLQGPLAAALALGEFMVRRRVFPGEHVSIAQMVRGLAASPSTASRPTGADASTSAADCAARSGNATRPPASGRDSARGPAA